MEIYQTSSKLDFIHSSGVNQIISQSLQQSTINTEKYYLWRAVDQDGNVLDILMQRHRDKAAANKFFRKLLKKQGFAPRVIVTDKLKSYGAAKRELLPNAEHRQHKGLNNRAENSHQPTRTRERLLRRFKSPGHAQRILSCFELLRQHFHPKQHQLSANEYRARDAPTGQRSHLYLCLIEYTLIDGTV